MRYKTVDDGSVKGIILTAESLLQIKDEIDAMGLSKEHKEGAEMLYDFLKGCYDKAHNKPKKNWW